MYENSFTLRRMLTAYGKPLQFAGRSTRTELLGYLIVAWLASIVLGYLAFAVGAAGLVDLGINSFNVVNFLLWLPFPALAVRRFHDHNKSGWWAAPLILPTIIAWLGGESLLQDPPLNIALVAIYLAALVLLFWKPTDGNNHFGPDPRIEDDHSQAAIAK